MAEKEVRLIVNGQQYSLAISPQKTLLEVLREELELTGAKVISGERVPANEGVTSPKIKQT